MNCVIYSRVSTLDQDNQRQIDELKRYADYMQYTLLGIFEEKITGASNAMDRIEFKRMVDLIDTNSVKHVLIWELSRLGRNTLDVLTTLKQFTDKGVNVYIKSGGLNTLNENGTKNQYTGMVTSMLSAFAEIERESIKTRSKSGIRQNVAYHGSGTGIIKPFGYRKEGKKMVIDPEEAEIVRTIFQKYLSGLSTHGIAEYLNNSGVKTRFNKLFSEKEIKLPKGNKKGTNFRWVDGTVYSILKNSIYMGKRKHVGEFFEMDAIVDATTFDEAQTLLNNNYNKKGINRKYTNIFKQKILCGKCGSSYFLHKRADNKDNSYKCLSKRMHVNCGNPSVGIDKLNNSVYPFIVNQVKNETKIDKNAKITELNKKVGNMMIEFNNVITGIKKIEKQEKNLAKMRIEENLSPETYTETYTELVSSKKILFNRYNMLRKQQKEYDDIMKVLKNIDNIDITTAEIYKEYVAEYIEYIKIYEIPQEGCIKSEFPNVQDLAVMVEIKPLFLSKSYHTVISQRSNKQLIVNLDEGENFRDNIINGSLDYLVVNIGSTIQINPIIEELR